MRTIALSVAFFLFFASAAFGQYILSGKVRSARDSSAVPFALVTLPAKGLSASADENGVFVIKNIPAGKITIAVSYLGYVRKEQEIAVTTNLTSLSFFLDEDNLLLKEVKVTAEMSEERSTSYVVDRKSFDHLQTVSITDITALLPGGKTSNSNRLTGGQQQFYINSRVNEKGNGTFGVGLEIDGVRLSNNSFGSMRGSDTRNIATSNVESIEIVTGIPSAEYGDISNGLVKINTRKGKSPFIADIVLKPHTRQFALSKGFALGGNGGVFNVSAERAKSVAELASPYTSYDRNSLSLNYSNTFNRNGNSPFSFTAGLSGNTGGMNTKSDPDFFAGTYSKGRDNTIRGSVSANWQLSRPWITSIEGSASLNFNDLLEESSAFKSGSSSTAARHVTAEGYHIGELYDENPNAGIILIPPGQWYEVKFSDSKVLNYQAKLKANWARRFGTLNNELMVGGDYSSSSNLGRGLYYQDPRYAPTWREYRLDQLPDVNNYSVFAEDNLTIPLGRSSLAITAGLRADITDIRNSAYGTVSSLSPRFNAKYTLLKGAKRTISDLSVRLGWGQSVKLPSQSVLSPQPEYTDERIFDPGTTADGKTFYAFYTAVRLPLYNPDLKWQKTRQREIALNMKVGGTDITLTANWDNTSNPYTSHTLYTPFSYKYTSQSALELSQIPIANRSYRADLQTGIIQVVDKTGVLPTETLPYLELLTPRGNDQYINGAPVRRRNFRWIIDFKKIAALNTSIRVDGNYYQYKTVDESIYAGAPKAIRMANGDPYKYIGFYVGGDNAANGSLDRQVNMNITATTHIPAIRLILTGRLESTLYDYSQNLSEYRKGRRGYVLDSKDAFLPSGTRQDIYQGDQFVATYPDYYVNLDDITTKIPFLEKFAWAKKNDLILYNDLSRLVNKTGNAFTFNEGGMLPYLSANLGITKEVGRTASITFQAKNFFSTTARVKSRQTGDESSLFNGTVPSFYYGLSLKVKW